MLVRRPPLIIEQPIHRTTTTNHPPAIVISIITISTILGQVILLFNFVLFTFFFYIFILSSFVFTIQYELRIRTQKHKHTPKIYFYYFIFQQIIFFRNSLLSIFLRARGLQWWFEGLQSIITRCNSLRPIFVLILLLFSSGDTIIWCHLVTYNLHSLMFNETNIHWP